MLMKLTLGRFPQQRRHCGTLFHNGSYINHVDSCISYVITPTQFNIQIGKKILHPLLVRYYNDLLDRQSFRRGRLGSLAVPIFKKKSLRIFLVESSCCLNSIIDLLGSPQLKKWPYKMAKNKGLTFKLKALKEIMNRLEGNQNSALEAFMNQCVIFNSF